MVADPCAAVPSPAEGVAEFPATPAAQGPGMSDARPPSRPRTHGQPPVTDWRGFHVALRRAALAAAQSGRPLSLLLLDLAGQAGAGPETAAGPAVAARIDALAGAIATGLGGAGALARYAEQRLAVIVTGADLGDAVRRAEQISSLTSSAAGELALPAIGVAQFRDDEALGHLIERATEALERARSAGSAIAVALPRARPRAPGAGAPLCPCGSRARACLCARA